MAGERRGQAAGARTTPWLPIALGVKTVIDAALCLKLAREQWQQNQAHCAYCQAATVAPLASVAVAAPEAIKAARHLFAR